METGRIRRHTFGRNKNRHYVLEALHFFLKGEEEVHYLYNNLVDLADSEKLLICHSLMAVPWHFMFDVVKRKPFLHPSNGWGMWWPGVFVGTKGWGVQQDWTRKDAKNLVHFVDGQTLAQLKRLLFLQRLLRPSRCAGCSFAGAVFHAAFFSSVVLGCRAMLEVVNMTWQLWKNICYVICHQSMIFFRKNKDDFKFNLKETKKSYESKSWLSAAHASLRPHVLLSPFVFRGELSTQSHLPWLVACWHLPAPWDWKNFVQIPWDW